MDFAALFGMVATKLHTSWLRETYLFPTFGRGVSIHYSCDIRRPVSAGIELGDQVFLGPDVWLNVVGLAIRNRVPRIRLGHGCKIGRRSTISCKNRIVLEDDVLTAPSVLIMDHSHEFSDPEKPIHSQGVTAGGTITIEKNCWLGFGAVVICNRGELRLGRNSVVGAHAIVTRSFPPCSVVVGNPARLIRRFDEQLGTWVRADG